MSPLDRAEIGIRRLHGRCADAVWRKDAEGFADCYAPEGVWKIVGQSFAGRDGIIGAFHEFLGRNQRVLMNFGAPLIEAGEGWARGRTYATELVKRADGVGQRTIGTYYEEFVEHDGQWLFVWRHFDMHYFGPPDMSDDFLPCPDYGPPPAMPPR